MLHPNIFSIIYPALGGPGAGRGSVCVNNELKVEISSQQQSSVDTLPTQSFNKSNKVNIIHLILLSVSTETARSMITRLWSCLHSPL